METGTARWVSVSERLPEKTQLEYKCLVKELSGVYTVFYGNVSLWGGLEVTHWLEVIPPPIPKQKKLKEYAVMLPSSRQYRMDVIGYMSGVDEVKAFIPHDAKSFKVTYETEED